MELLMFYENAMTAFSTGMSYLQKQIEHTKLGYDSKTSGSGQGFLNSQHLLFNDHSSSAKIEALGPKRRPPIKICWLEKSNISTNKTAQLLKIVHLTL